MDFLDLATNESGDVTPQNSNIMLGTDISSDFDVIAKENRDSLRIKTKERKTRKSKSKSPRPDYKKRKERSNYKYFS